MIKLMIVDDHGIVRDGLQRLMDAFDDIEVVGCAQDGATAVELIPSLRPTVVLMDLEMPGRMDGVSATKAITEADPSIQVLVLTSFSDRDRIVAALDAGAIGYMLKDSPADDLVRAVRTAAQGESPIDPKAARTLLELTTQKSPVDGMSDREREVLNLLAVGLPNKEIARRLNITERTVKGHLTSIYREIGVTDRTQAALWAREHRLGTSRRGRA